MTRSIVCADATTAHALQRVTLIVTAISKAGGIEGKGAEEWYAVSTGGGEMVGPLRGLVNSRNAVTSCEPSRLSVGC